MVRYNGWVWLNIAVTFFYHPIYMIIELKRFFVTDLRPLFLLLTTFSCTRIRFMEHR